MSNRRIREPMLNLPDVLKWLSGAFIAVHIFRWLLGMLLSPRNELILSSMFAFHPRLYLEPSLDAPVLVAMLLGPFTYMLLHADIMHLLGNSVMLLAFGSLLARRMKPAWFIAFLVVCSFSGALLYFVLSLGDNGPVVGASGGVAGVVGGLLRLAQQRQPPAGGPLQEREKQIILAFGALWLMINLFLAFQGLKPGAQFSSTAWQAHLGGFIGGLLAINFFDGRGFRRLERRRPNLQVIKSDRE